MTDQDGQPLKKWYVVKDSSDINSGVCQTLDEVRQALDWYDDPIEDQLFHAQRLLDHWDLPPNLRTELQSFVDHPDVWV